MQVYEEDRIRVLWIIGPPMCPNVVRSGQLPVDLNLIGVELAAAQSRDMNLQRGLPAACRSTAANARARTSQPIGSCGTAATPTLLTTASTKRLGSEMAQPVAWTVWKPLVAVATTGRRAAAY